MSVHTDAVSKFSEGPAGVGAASGKDVEGGVQSAPEAAVGGRRRVMLVPTDGGLVGNVP